ncbi:MAG: hypothetical protein CL946_01145 [Ectothiorhodospiraceae bacterium]|nr:hypothetical protein [Ectothiorhodospiraceae bacterium]
MTLFMFTACSDDDPVQPVTTPDPQGDWNVLMETITPDEDTIQNATVLLSKKSGMLYMEMPVQCEENPSKEDCTFIWEEHDRYGNTVYFHVWYRYRLEGTLHSSDVIWVEADFDKDWKTFTTDSFISVVDIGKGSQCRFVGNRAN